MPYDIGLHLLNILAEADIFGPIGTSGNDLPAAGFSSQRPAATRAHTIELNLERSAVAANQFAEHRTGTAPASSTDWVEELRAPRKTAARFLNKPRARRPFCVCWKRL